MFRSLVGVADLFFEWRVPPASPDDMKKARAVVTQACSRLRNGRPGPGDVILAEKARGMSAAYGNLPVLA